MEEPVGVAGGHRHMLVAVFGATDLETLGAPLPPLQRHPGPLGHPQVQLRPWARRVSELLSDQPASELAGALRLPKIEPVLSALAGRASSVQVVLVASAQDDQRFRPGDTEDLADVLVALLPVIAARHGISLGPDDVWPVTLRGNPTDPRTMWEQAVQLPDTAVGAADEIHLTLMGGTPTMGTAVATRLWQAAERGLVTVRAWRVEDGRAVADEAVGVAARASITTRLGELAQRWRFEDVATLAESTDALAADGAERLARLARTGAQLLDLNLRVEIPAEAWWLHRHCRELYFPDTWDTPSRGALADFRPLARLMLAALRVREQRGEPLMMLSLLHLLAEYLPVMAWQPVLGHAADPAALPSHVQRAGSLWGVASNECAHSEPMRATAARVVGDQIQRPLRWRWALRRDYSVLAAALRTCGLRGGVSGPAVRTATSGCPSPCSVVTQLDDETVADLDRRLRMATRVSNGEIMALRHAAPVGHFFGTPTVSELAAAWSDTARKINDVDQPSPPIPVDSHDITTQLAHLVSLVAGGSVTVSPLFDELREELLHDLESL
jgi:hypothetical protein